MSLRYAALLLLVQNTMWAQGPLALRKVVLNGKQQTFSGKPIHLKAGESDLLLEFSPFKSDSVDYLYRLKGLENKWTESA